MDSLIGNLVAGILLFLYAFGMYEIISDDHRYTTKDVVIGVVIFPYPWWVGVKESYRFITTSYDDRKIEEQCLDTSETFGMPQKARLRFCECLIETKDGDLCKARIFRK